MRPTLGRRCAARSLPSCSSPSRPCSGRSCATARRRPGRRTSSVYSGLGTWISIFGTKAYSQPDAVAAAIAARGVKTVYMETSNFSQPADVVRPAQLGQFVDALHSRGLHVVAWYLPGFVNPALDLRRAVAAVQFRTAAGGAFDGFALDIESAAVKRAAVRTKRALALSQQLRTAVGDAYPLGAIIPSPRGMAIKPAYWPSFPYTQLAGIYDVFLPMVYWTYSTKGPDGAYGYLAWALTLLRAGAGDPNLPIHLVGGTSYTATAGRGAGVRAARDGRRAPPRAGASTTGSARRRPPGRRSPGSRRPADRYRSPKRSSRMSIRASSRKPSETRIERDIAPAWVTSTGVPWATASSQRARTSAR